MDLKNQPQFSSIFISVIIPFYGDKNDLKKCLKGLELQNFEKPFEIIVIESGNDPEVTNLVNSTSNSILISSGSLAYPGKARNLGAHNSKAGLLAFLDADCVPLSNWLSEIYLSLNSGFDVVIGPVINLYPFHPIASTDNLLQFPDFQKYQSLYNISHFPACNLGIRKNLFIETGGFPEDTTAGEDVIFSESLLKKKRDKTQYNRQLIIKHSGRKYFKDFLNHNKNLGFYRGSLNLKMSNKKNKLRGTFLYAFLFGIKRIDYISVRTMQWNPIGMLRLLGYFPVFIIGISAWVYGFWKGNKKYLERQT